MPVSALPGPYGIGSFGRAAYDFVDFLVRTRQRYWQILPLTTTSFGDSPYQSFSAFAGNPYFIDFDELLEEGLLAEDDLAGADFGDDPALVDYGRIFTERRRVLERAVPRFFADPPADLDAFLAENASWLDPYCEFMAVKEAFGLRAYHEWPPECRRRGAASARVAEGRPEAVRYHRMTQYLFFSQWRRLKRHANDNGVLVIGDIPIYVSRDSVEMWASPELFLTDAAGDPTSVAGTPPDQFSSTGQYWGNPIYDWRAMEEDGFSWWVERMRAALGLYDVVRIDHFRGFESFWEVPFGSATSAAGSWSKGPGTRLFERLSAELGELPVIAEDLGFLTPEVVRMVEETGFPGMKVLQFAFDGRHDSYYLPHHYAPNTVAYVGTHDNQTARGWYERTATPLQREQADRYLHRAPGEPASAAFVRGIAASPSDTCVYCMQDLLDLGDEARINVPATVGGNWRWRLLPGAVTREVEEGLARLTETYFRVPGAPAPELPR
jgi:4-alpha-glucanotransferase